MVKFTNPHTGTYRRLLEVGEMVSYGKLYRLASVPLSFQLLECRSLYLPQYAMNIMMACVFGYHLTMLMSTSSNSYTGKRQSRRYVDIRTYVCMNYFRKSAYLPVTNILYGHTHFETTD